MSIDPKVKKQWEKLQEQYDYPVDALGRPIDPNDQEMLRVWRDEGIDRFTRK
jgi:DNA replication protein DnaD